MLRGIKHDINIENVKFNNVICLVGMKVVSLVSSSIRTRLSEKPHSDKFMLDHLDVQFFCLKTKDFR